MTTTSHPYAGMWVTGDGSIRHELRPDGRYVEARGTRERAYTEVTPRQAGLPATAGRRVAGPRRPIPR